MFFKSNCKLLSILEKGFENIILDFVFFIYSNFCNKINELCAVSVHTEREERVYICTDKYIKNNLKIRKVANCIIIKSYLFCFGCIIS